MKTSFFNFVIPFIIFSSSIFILPKIILNATNDELINFQEKEIQISRKEADVLYKKGNLFFSDLSKNYTNKTMYKNTYKKGIFFMEKIKSEKIKDEYVRE